MTSDQPRPGTPVRGSTTGRPVMALFDLVGRRWILRVVWELHCSQRPQTFRELRARCSDMSASVLTTRLGELREARLVTRTADGYTLTELGGDLVDNMRPLLGWSARWAEHLEDREHRHVGEGAHPPHRIHVQR